MQFNGAEIYLLSAAAHFAFVGFRTARVSGFLESANETLQNSRETFEALWET